ncbi:hypothetical protein LG302_01005 [Halomonas organivorans]
MPNRSGGRYEVRHGEPVLVDRTQEPEPSRAQPAPPELTGPTDEQEDADDADA